MTPEYLKYMKNYIKAKRRKQCVSMRKQLRAYGIVINEKNYILNGRKKPKKRRINNTQQG